MPSLDSGILKEKAMDDELMMIHKITPFVEYNYLLNSFATTNFEQSIKIQ